MASSAIAGLIRSECIAANYPPTIGRTQAGHRAPDRCCRLDLVTPTRGPEMRTERLSAFTDGVIAIIITIMVLELRVPHGADLSALSPLLPVFLTYLLSFV